MLDARNPSAFVQCYLALQDRDRANLERLEYLRVRQELVFHFRGGTSSAVFKLDEHLTDFELREEERRLQGVLVEQVPPVSGVTFAIVDSAHSTVSIPNCAVLFVGGAEDGRIIRGFDAQPYVISLKTGAPRLRGHRTEVLSSRSVEAARAGGYTMDHLRRIYTKYGVHASHHTGNNYELAEVDDDLYIYRHIPE